jgi:hypothetical protein
VKRRYLLASTAVRNFDDFSGFAADGQVDRPTANRAILDQGLFWLRGVDLERKDFAAMGTGNIYLDD